MGLGGSVRERRRERELTQSEVAALGGLGVRTLAALEAGREDEVHLSDLARICLVLELAVVLELTGPDGETHRTDLGPQGRYGPIDLFVPERLPVRRGELASALDELLAGGRRRPGRTSRHLRVDPAYRLQLEELLLGRAMTPDDDWDQLDWRGTPVDLADGLDDRAQLVRTRRLARWPGPVAEAWVVPEGLTDAGAEAYRTLREDGRALEEAHEAAALLERVQ